jgi:hypothetical protein
MKNQSTLLLQTSHKAWIHPGRIPRIVKILKKGNSYWTILSRKNKTYIFKKKCKVHPTWIKAASGGRKIAKIVKRLKIKDLHKLIM